MSDKEKSDKEKFDKEKSDKEKADDDSSWRQILLRQMSTSDESSRREEKVKKGNRPLRLLSHQQSKRNFIVF
jgi:hypothetical protein